MFDITASKFFTLFVLIFHLVCLAAGPGVDPGVGPGGGPGGGSGGSGAGVRGVGLGRWTAPFWPPTAGYLITIWKGKAFSIITT